MSERIRNLLIILVVTIIALIQPLYQLSIKGDIVTLGLDLKGGVSVLLQANPPMGQAVNPEDMNGLIEVIRNRIDPQGQKEIILSLVGTDRVLVQVPGEKDPEGILKLIGETALLEWIDAGDTFLEKGTDITDKDLKVIFTGRDLADASLARDSFGRPAVGFRFKDEAAERFGEYTANNVGRYLAVALDKKIITSPVINSPIWGGQGIIEGGFNLEEASLLARQLKGGALPVPVVVLENRVVGPSLGKESIDTSLKAGAYAFIAILLFMLILYRLPGLVANLALCLYVVLVIGYTSLLNVTLTLPGIAGILLSIGMAIDANIIIFERLKEELSWGKTLKAAVETAFARAWIAILDGNLTTLIAAVILFFFGTGPVKGFAITLSIGILLSMFSAVFVTRFALVNTALKVRSIRLYA